MREVIAGRISEWIHLPKYKISGVVDDFLRLIVQSLIADGFIRIRGFGTFRVRKTPERVIHNVRTGETEVLVARWRVFFKPSAKMTAEINSQIESRRKAWGGL